MTNVPLIAISQGMIGIDSVHTSRLYAGAPHAGYESEFPPETEGVEDGCGTTVDGSNETTPRSASFASRQFFLIITLIQARRSSEWSPVDEKNRCFSSNSLFRSRYERTYCQLAILDPRRCTASPSPLDSRERTGQVAFFSIFNPTCPLSSRQVIESSLCICFLSCWFAHLRLPRPSWKPTLISFLTLATLLAAYSGSLPIAQFTLASSSSISLCFPFISPTSHPPIGR